jgi:hypothetical protein
MENPISDHWSLLLDQLLIARTTLQLAEIISCSDIVLSIDLKPGLADPGLKPGQVEEKIGKEKTRCDPADPTG